MRLHADQLHCYLRHHETLALRNARGARVRCISGVVWLTEEGVKDDVFLSGGDEYVLTRCGLALLRAELETSFVLSQRRETAVWKRWRAAIPP